MNHIYKSIFNKALGVFTAVPEFASAHGKGSERTVVGRVAKGTAGFAASALAISVGLALTSTSAVAGPGIYINDGTDTGCLAVPDAQGPNVGIHGISGGVPSAALSLLGPSQVVPDRSYYGLDVMKPCLSSTAANATEERSTQTNRTLFYGKNGPTSVNDNGAKNLTLGGRLDVNSGIIGVGDRGTNGAGATNSIRMGTGTTLDEANKKENAISIGVNTKATEVWATAIGANAVASGGSASQALGYDAVASGKSAIAQGYHSHANGQSAVAIGDNAKASSIATVSIGYMANGQVVDVDKDNTPSTTKATYGTAVGHYAGADYTGTDNESITALGNHAGRYGEGGRINTAVGSHAGMYVKGSQNVAMGNYAGSGDATNKLEGSNTVSIGSFAKASGENGVAMGYVSAASGIGSIALGKSAEATDQRAIAMGENARAGNEASMALGYNSSAKGSKQVSIGLGAGALKKATDAGAELATFVGHYAGADNAAATGNAQGVAVGVNAGRYGVAGIRNVAVGSNTGQTVNGDDNTSIGYNSGRSVEGAGNFSGGLNSGVFVKGSNNVALGSNAGNGTAAQALEVNNTTSIGNNAKALTDDSISIGRDSKAGKVDKFDGKKSIAIGYSSEAMGSNAIALGSNAATNNGHDSIAMGTYAKTNGEKTISIGAYNTAEGAQSIVIAGNYDASTGSNRSTTTAAAKRAIVVGPESHATAEDAVAIGNKNTVASARTYAIGNNINVAANTDDSLVFGTRAHTDFSRSIAMGVNASTLGQTGVAIGDNAVTNGVNQISIGHKAGDVTETDNKKTRRPNVGNFGVMIGHYAGAEYTADEVTPVNHQHGTVAVGTQAGRAGKDSWSNIALGNQAGRAVHGNDNIAIGVNSGSGKMTDKVESDGKDVSTVDEYLNVKHSISVGTMSAGKNNYSIAIGTQATAGNGQKEADGSTKNGYSVAIGTSANASALNSVALGAAASASHEYSVALGRDSKTSDVHTGVYTLNTSYAAAGQPNAANGTVSVGSAGKERQIQNVAAGVISATSTDAINGSQLYATNNYMNNFAGDVKTKLGGNAALANDGHLTMTNIGGTGKDNVNDAIAAANTKVAAGENITVTPTTNADGSKTYTVATKKDLVVDSVKAGDTTVNTDGVTIAGGPSVKKDGINAGDKKITGVADGNVAAGSKDAVNGGQLAEVKAKADSAVQEVESENPTALSVKKDGTKVTLTPNFIAGNLVNADGTVKDPAAADEGKLVSAKTVADALKANHFVVDTKANGGTVDASVSEENAKVGSGNKVTFEAGKNLVAQQTNTANGGATVNYKLSDTLENLVSVKSAEIEAGIGPNKVVLNNNGVKVGDSTLNDKGLSINNGPSVTDAGIDAGNKKITGVADGNVAAGSTDAVNGGQLAEVKSKADSAVQNVVSANPTALTANKVGDTVTLTPNFIAGDLVNADGTVNTPAAADEGKLVSAKAVADALKANHFVVDTKGNTETGSEADAKVGSSNKVTFEAGKNLIAKQANTANGGATVKFSLQDDISLNSVTAGTGDNQVVLNDAGVNVGGNTYINNDGLNANSKVIS
ncbi:Hep/Hag repeat protein, partial [Aggregatibacter sp. oral taxon 458 str. W10330]|uniref:ESPR-type extended signal peptide-containing protein n=1 Tax=Aggregatibacter sp. oral taxon 458 TaxID=712148 RepID=UPI0003967B7A